MDNSLLAILACPKCRGSIEETRAGAKEGLLCPACAVVYPIEEEIPVLLIEAAIALEQWQAGAGAGAQERSKA